MASESVDVPEVQELQNEIRIMKHDFEDQIKEIKENLLKVVQGKVDGHEKWIRRIESDADTKESKFHEEMKLKEKQLQELKAELAETKEETKKHLMETEKMQTELAEIKKEMKKQETEKEKQIKELRTNLTECEEKMKEMRTEHEEKHKSLLEELQVKDTRIFILEEKINEVEEHGKGNEKEIGKLASEMNMKAEKLIELESRMNEQKEKYIQLYYQIGEKGEKISQVEEMLWKKSGEISEVMHIDRETSERQFGEIMFKLNEGKKLTQSVLTENRCPFVWEVTNIKEAKKCPLFHRKFPFVWELKLKEFANGTKWLHPCFIKQRSQIGTLRSDFHSVFLIWGGVLTR
ncbi:golgin subfamily A member 6-like protein 22 [Clytia hemisphaerica]